jgi:hypothetical protein
MLLHCVTFVFTSSASPSDIDAFVGAVAALPSQVDVSVRLRSGVDLGEREQNADFAVVAEFECLDDFESYLAHPAHRALPLNIVESMSRVQFLVDDK